MSFEKRCQLEFCASKCKTKQNLFLKRRSDNLTNTSMACQGLCTKLCRKLTAKIETPKIICFDSKTHSMLYNHEIEVRSNINCWKWISI